MENDSIFNKEAFFLNPLHLHKNQTILYSTNDF